ncbi:Bardet-Biedl syndrome 1 protein homolog [Homalodisca vitripennis]|nr:Bardet-Biedl syndrome 1 protein homolog [Homalodisca vitripennis]
MSSRSIQLQQLWIDAFNDSQANLQTFSSCMTLADLSADENYKLILADSGSGSTHVKLKVYSGTSLACEVPLLDAPSALVSIYTDNNEPRIPGIAVACGANVLVYRNCRPYFKFSLPLVDGSSLEADVWRQKSQTTQLIRLLQDLSKELGYSNLSAPSQMLLALEPAAREEFAFKHRHCSIKKQTVITCMTTIEKNVADDKAVSCLVLATESKQLFVLDPEAFTIADTFPLTFVAYLLSASGLYTVDYSVLLVSLTGAVCVMRAGIVTTLTQLPACPVSVLQVARTFVTANMDNTLQCYSLKGVKQWSVILPGSPVTLASVPLVHQALHLVAVAVTIDTGGCVLLYSGPQLMHSFITPQHVSALVFGRYGREEHALVSVSDGGALSVKLLKRTAQFGSGERQPTSQDKPHNIKLLVPKKSKLFVEQTLREREQFKEIHQRFHRDWLGLSVAASEAYVNALRNATVCQREALKLTAQVLGLGPKLKVQLFLENLATDYVPAGLAVTFTYDHNIYTIHSPHIPVPMLVPGLTCCLETLVTCHSAIVGQLTVLVFARRVLLSAIISMPPAAVLT